MKGIDFFLAIPVSIEVISLHSSAIVSRENPIDVEHRYQDPSDLVMGLHEPIHESLHYP